MRTIVATAPVRICDIGGWSDTWFAGHGAVFHMAVRPGVEVRMRVYPAQTESGGGPAVGSVSLDVGEGAYTVDLSHPLPGRQPLLEATLAEVGLPGDVSVEVAVSSAVPAGSATGTSAAVTVALIGALDATAGRARAPHELAALAHRIETERLGNESGVQDQIAAAFGGINYVEIPAYPNTRVTSLALPDPIWEELDRRLLLVSLGRPHVSSEVHERVIAGIEADGSSPLAALEALRSCAAAAREAIELGDLEQLGRAMAENTDAQARLHPDLVNADARRVIELAAAAGACGWKVNGAGGDGGSVTLMCGPDPGSGDRLLAALGGGAGGPGVSVIPMGLSRDGLRVRVS